MSGYLVPPKESLKGRQLLVFSPMLNRHDVAHYFPEGTLSYQTWEDALRWLEDRHGSQARTVVVKCASQQILTETESS